MCPRQQEFERRVGGSLQPTFFGRFCIFDYIFHEWDYFLLLATFEFSRAFRWIRLPMKLVLAEVLPGQVGGGGGGQLSIIVI